MTTDHMHGMDADRLLSWILEDLRQGSALGIVRDLFFTPKKNDPFRMKRYGIELETPLGAAAGPHTQMAQNIIAAWLCGARMGGPSVYFGTLTPKPWLGPEQGEAVPWGNARLLALCQLLRYSALCGGLTLWLCATVAGIPFF